MKPWRDLTTDEKCDRLACEIYRLSRPKKEGAFKTFETLVLDRTPEGHDDYLGVFGGHLTDKKAA